MVMSQREVPPSATRCEMTWLVLPSQTNALGSAFGGALMSWIDICAAVSAQRFSRVNVVTAAIDQLFFRTPIRKGDVVVLQSMVNWAGRTSMEVGVTVEREVRQSGERFQACFAYLTFVAVDDAGVPTPVPRLLPQTEEEKRRFEAAIRRRERRLTARKEEELHARGETK